MIKANISSIKKSVIDKIQEKEQALNGWIAIDTAGNTSASGNFSGIKVMAGEVATLTLMFKDDRCNVNGVTIDLVEGDYMATPGLISATITAGKVFLIKGQMF